MSKQFFGGIIMKVTSLLLAAIFSATAIASVDPIGSAATSGGVSLTTQAKIYVYSAESMVDGLLAKFENDNAIYYACRDVEALLEINAAFTSANEDLMKEIVNIGGQWTMNNLASVNSNLVEISNLCKVGTSTGFSKAEKKSVIENVILIQSASALETLGG